MNIAIVAGGKLLKQFLTEIQQADFIIGVDRGALWLLQQKITPDVAIGDFDSVTRKEFQKIKQKVKKVIEFSKKKAATDLELAVDYAIKQKSERVIIFGGIGTRLDHTIAAVHLLEKLTTSGKIIDSRNEIELVRKALHVFPSHRYVSILPYTKKIVVSLSGFAYPLSRKELVRSTSRGISNEVVGKKAKIEVHEGIALVIKSRD